MANRFTELQDNDNIVDAVNQLEQEISDALDGIDDSIGEPAAAIADAAPDGSDAVTKINAILGGAALEEYYRDLNPIYNQLK